MKEMVVCCRQEMETTCSREREQHVESLVESRAGSGNWKKSLVWGMNKEAG